MLRLSVENDSDFRHPPLLVGADELRRGFAASVSGSLAPLRNPHREPKVTDTERRSAVPAAVLIPLLLHAGGITVLLTRRHEAISFAGHVCFPGGRADPDDRDPVHTAVREAEEEIALDPARVEVVGRLGDYVTHSGYRIAPIVGLIHPPIALAPRPGEVEEILEIPLARALDSRSYALRASPNAPARAYFVLEHDAVRVTGPTVSILMGFYEHLLEARRRLHPAAG